MKSQGIYIIGKVILVTYCDGNPSLRIEPIEEKWRGTGWFSRRADDVDLIPDGEAMLMVLESTAGDIE